MRPNGLRTPQVSVDTVALVDNQPGVDKTHYTEKCPGADFASFNGTNPCTELVEVPPVQCTLCWADGLCKALHI
jgi:hypothetical protein